MNEVAIQNVTVGPGLFSWVFLREPRLPRNPKPDDIPKYQISLLWDKDQTAITQKVQQCIMTCVHKKWGPDKAKWPQLQLCISDGDKYLAKLPAEKRAALQYYQGKIFMNTSNEQQPLMVGPTNDPIIDANQIYSGCTGYLLVNFWPYDTRNYGVTAFVQGVMKISDGERLDGRVSTEQVQAQFAQFAVSAPAEGASDADVASFLG